MLGFQDSEAVNLQTGAAAGPLGSYNARASIQKGYLGPW